MAEVLKNEYWNLSFGEKVTKVEVDSVISFIETYKVKYANDLDRLCEQTKKTFEANNCNSAELTCFLDILERDKKLVSIHTSRMVCDILVKYADLYAKKDGELKEPIGATE